MNLDSIREFLSSAKKSIIQIATLVIAIGTPALNWAGVIHLPPNVLLAISTVVAIAGSVLHYLVPNTTTNPVLAARSSVKLVAARQPGHAA